MYPIYFNYAYVFVLVQSLIVFVEVFVNLKNPPSLKIAILFFLFSAVLFCLGNIYSNFFSYSSWVVETPAVLLAIAIVNVLSLLYEFKIKRKVIVFGFIVILIQQLVSLLVNPSIIDYLGVKDFRVYVRLVVTLIAFLFVFDFFFKIVKKYKSENVYYRQLIRWSFLFVLNLSIILIANFIKVFLGPNNLISRSLIILSLLSTVLAILFRPNFMNYTSLKPISNILKRDNDIGLSKEMFFETFFRSQYYLNRDASFEALRVSLEVNAETLTNFIFVNYGLSYTDLVNKNRINYFLDLLKAGEYNNYTIEGLSLKSGFNSRHHLYKCFKKFQGGTPNSYIQELH